VSAASDHVHRYAGTSREIGRAAGRSLGSRLEQTIERFMAERQRHARSLDPAELHRGALPWLRTLPQRFQDELEGVAEGARLPLQRVAEWNYIEVCIDDGCSGIVGRLDGHLWVARNNDAFVPGVEGDVTIREVTGRIPTVAFGMPGDVFYATGVNRERLWLHHQSLPNPDAPRPGQPHLPGWVLLADMLETCASIGDVEARLDEIDRDEGMILFAVDGRREEFAILECSSTRRTRRPSRDPWLAATNHACALDGVESDEGSRLRQARMEAMATALYARQPEVSLPRDLVRILADSGVERRGPRLTTVYSTVACPGAAQLWFTFGAFPAASSGDWQPVPWPW
jgi:hypothetical protein